MGRLNLGLGLNRLVGVYGGGAPSFGTARSTIVDFHNEDMTTGGFRGFDADGYIDGPAVTYEPTVTVTTADALRTAVESWRASPDEYIKIECDWDGISDMASPALRGPSSTTLTNLGLADASAPGGYLWPDGGLWITPASGRSPVIGAASGGSLQFQGVSRICWDGVGVSIPSGGVQSTRNIWARRPSSFFPNWPIVAIINSNIGGATHRPLDAISEYSRGVESALVWAMHIENCLLDGCRQQITGTAKYQRVFTTQFRKSGGDVIDHFGFNSADWTGATTSCWINGNVVSDVLDDALFTGLHTDFYQFTSDGEERDLVMSLVEHNTSHAPNTVPSDAATQFAFSRHYDGNTESHLFVSQENVGAISASWCLLYADHSGTHHFYSLNNTFMRAGGTYQDTDSWTRVGVDEDVPAGAGIISIENTVVTEIYDTNGVVDTVSDMLYVDPRMNVVSGTGLTEASPLRPEDAFVGTFTRDGSDFLTYTIPGEAGADFSAARTAIRDFFTMRPAYAGRGASPI